MAALLERKEVVTHPAGVREGPEAPLARPGEELVEALVEADLAQLDPGLVRLQASDGADELDDPGGAAPAVQEPERSARPPMREARATCRAGGSAAPSQPRARAAPPP